jgi:hypothetical protein
LLEGFFTVTEKAVAVAAITALGVAVNVGRVAFCAAMTGAARGIRNTAPESTSNASIVPELNFVRYAFVGVFIIIFGHPSRRTVFKACGRFIYF